MNRRTKQTLLSILALLVVLGIQWWMEREGLATKPPPGERTEPGTAPREAPEQPRGEGPRPPPPGDAKAGERAIQDAFRAGRSDVWATVDVEVLQLWRDDTIGSKHQLFLAKLASGLTLKISHNISLAPRVPVRVGDWVRIRGEYEYNEKGGVLHWTHHDPRGRRRGGWIHHKGRTYK